GERVGGLGFDGGHFFFDRPGGVARSVGAVDEAAERNGAGARFLADLAVAKLRVERIGGRDTPALAGAPFLAAGSACVLAHFAAGTVASFAVPSPLGHGVFGLS